MFKKRYLFLILIALSFFIALSFKVGEYFIDNRKSTDIIKRVTKEEDNKEYIFVNPEANEETYYDYKNEPFMQVNFKDLLEQNEETVAWINVLGTNIDYPVVQSTDNSFYLDHTFDKTKNIAGWVFSDFRNNMQFLNKNTIIYAHKMTNKTMFGSLPLLLDKNWFEDKLHHLIKLSTPNSNMIWQIFSVYTIPKESYYITTHFKTDNDYQNFLDTINDRSIFNFDVSLDTDSKIITLSTCKDYKGNRIVVHAKLIKQETRQDL